MTTRTTRTRSKAPPQAETETKEVTEVKPMSKDNVIAAIKGMTVMELAELVKSLETEFGVSAAVPMAVAAPSYGAAGPAAPAVEEQTEFSVILKEFAANKINVIKAGREL